MNIVNHSPDSLLSDLREACVQAVEALTHQLELRGVQKPVFLLAVTSVGLGREHVQMASNLEPVLAEEFLQLLASGGEIVSKGTVQ